MKLVEQYDEDVGEKQGSRAALVGNVVLLATLQSPSESVGECGLSHSCFNL